MRKKVVNWLENHSVGAVVVATIAAPILSDLAPEIFPWWLTSTLIVLILIFAAARIATSVIKELDLHRRRLHQLEKGLAWVSKRDYRADYYAQEVIEKWPDGSASTYSLFTEKGEQLRVPFEDLPRFLVTVSGAECILWTDLGVVEDPKRNPRIFNEGKGYDYNTRVLDGTREECLAYVLRAAPDGGGVWRQRRILFSIEA